MTEPDNHPENYEDVTVYALDDADEQEMLVAQNECTFIWANKEGWPVGVIMSYFFEDGKFWLTLSSQRARVAAVRRDPRVAVCVTSKGTTAPASRTVTYKGICTIHDDETTKAWMYPRLAEALWPGQDERQRWFVKFLDSPRRIIFSVTPTQRIGYDGQKMGQATVAWMQAAAEEE